MEPEYHEMHDLKILYQVWSSYFSAMIYEGKFDFSKVEKNYDLNLPEFLCMELGSQKSGMISNGMVLTTAMWTSQKSALEFSVTENLVAKKFYFLGSVFSASAVFNSAIAII